ncbi:MAG: hypothetical protein AAF125_19415, partial [Chloroflexota bacterium]
MLLRLYRLTDKIGLAVLKLFAASGEYLLEGVQIAVEGLRGGLFSVLGTVWRVVRRLLRLLWQVLRAIFARVSQLLGLFWGLFSRGARTAGTAAQSAASNVSSGQRIMARRAERAEARNEMEIGLVEDPLRTQNRALSVLVVAMGFLLVGALIWATSLLQSAPAAPAIVADASGGEITFAEDVTPTPTTLSIVNTAVPTATSIPSILEVRGSIAYVARERGQTDIWAVNVGGSTPLRLTNDPADERDP